MSEEGNANEGRIIPALRCRNAAAAIDWLCAAFGFERKMVVLANGGRVAHAELALGNGMIMLGDVETEYGRLVAAPNKGEPVTQGIYVVVENADSRITLAPRPRVPRSCSTSRRRTMAAATTRRAILKAMSGPSAPMILGQLRRNGGGEGLLEEGAAELQPGRVNAMAQTLSYMPFDRKPGLRELLAGKQHGIDGDDLVHVSMHEKDRGARTLPLDQCLGIGERP